MVAGSVAGSVAGGGVGGAGHGMPLHDSKQTWRIRSYRGDVSAQKPWSR